VTSETSDGLEYGVGNIDLYRGAAWYVDRILKREKSGDLPVQHATKFELVINVKTAKVLGLEVPISLLARTGEVIECVPMCAPARQRTKNPFCRRGPLSVRKRAG
jgi:ABC transporter substrate binding protein